jgi:hypothetical protein
MDSKLPVRHRTGRSLDNIAAVSGSAAESAGPQCVQGKNTRNYAQYFLTLVLFTFCTCWILRCLVCIVVSCQLSCVYCCSCLVCTVVILCVFAVLCVYCCLYFRCRTAG